MRRGLLGLVALVSAGLVMMLRRLTAVVIVDGDSMWPTYAPGDRVLVRRARENTLRPGQVVVVEQPGEDGTWATRPRGPVGRRHWVIKRVAAVPGDPTPQVCWPATAGSDGERVPARKLVLLGDNPDWSHDSRQIGYFPAERLLGVVVRRMVTRGGCTSSSPAPVQPYPGQRPGWKPGGSQRLGRDRLMRRDREQPPR